MYFRRMVLDRSPVSEPVAQFQFSSRIFVTELSPFEWSANLIALGLADSVIIGQIKLPEEDESCQVFGTISTMYKHYRGFQIMVIFTRASIIYSCPIFTPQVFIPRINKKIEF